MIQQTSIDAYHNIRTNGLLSKRRFEVFDQIYQRGPITLNRLIEILYKPGKNTSSISARLSELQRHDVIEADGTIKASTGNTVTLWKATGRLPKKLIRKKKNNNEDPVLLRRAFLRLSEHVRTNVEDTDRNTVEGGVWREVREKIDHCLALEGISNLSD